MEPKTHKAEPEIYHTECYARLILDKTYVDISGFGITYAVDQIPTAQVVISVGERVVDPKFDVWEDKKRGRDVSRVTQVSTSFLLSRIVPFTPVTVEIKFNNISRPNVKRKDGYPDLDFPFNTVIPIFQGYVGIIEQEKQITGVVSRFVIKCYGRIAALAGASRLSNTIAVIQNPNASVDLNTNKLIRIGGVKGLLDTQEACGNIFAAVLKGALDDILKDIWNNGIRLMIEEAIRASGTWVGSNANIEDAIVALEKINPGNVIKSPALAINASNKSSSLLAIAISKHLAESAYSLWTFGNGDGDCLEMAFQLGNSFCYHMVPTIEEDAFVPLFWGLGGETITGRSAVEPWRLIETREYSSIAQVKETKPGDYSLITDVALYATNFIDSPWAFADGKATPLNVDNNRVEFTRASSIAKAIGVATARSNVLSRNPLALNFVGRTLVIQAPSWLIVPSNDAVSSTKELPDAIGLPDGFIPSPYPETKVAYFDEDLGNRYAECILYREMFKSRQLVVRGKFRLDIAPGSFVAVELIGSTAKTFAKKGDDDIVYGNVMSVELVMEAGSDGGSSGNIRTTFVISHIRSSLEQSLVGFYEHPIYQTVWRGCPLANFTFIKK